MSEKKVITKVLLPSQYDGRCKSGNFLTSFPGAKKYGDRKYEMRLPVPKDDDEAQRYYGVDLFTVIRWGIAKLATDLDGRVFLPALGDSPTTDDHIAAQRAVDRWHYEARKAKAPSVGLVEMVGRLKALGTIPEDAEISTKEDLFKYLA